MLYKEKHKHVSDLSPINIWCAVISSSFVSAVSSVRTWSRVAPLSKHCTVLYYIMVPYSVGYNLTDDVIHKPSTDPSVCPLGVKINLTFDEGLSAILSEQGTSTFLTRRWRCQRSLCFLCSEWKLSSAVYNNHCFVCVGRWRGQRASCAIERSPVSALLFPWC